jgi:hypothetical protein
MFEQNWQQFRHVENERLGFTAIYCAVVSGVLSFLTTWDERGSLAVSVALIAFLLLFTLLGLLVSLRLRAAVRHHRAKLIDALKKMGVRKKKWRDIGVPGTGGDWTRPFGLGNVLPAFYSLAFFMVLSVLIAILV